MLYLRPVTLLTVFTAPILAVLGFSLIGCGAPDVVATSELSATEVSLPVGSEKGTENPPVTAKRTPLKPGARTVVLARAGDKPYDKTFDDLRFDIQPGQPFHRDMLPQPIETMAGQRIRIRGYILPTPQKRGIKTFVLVRDNQECCFGPGAALYDCILVEMKPGATAEYTIRPVAVEGTFAINEVKNGDMHLAIYHLDADSVR
jgi:hypothetical protein